eukprot:Sdes_comp19568_c0_seq1m11246
MTMSDSKYFSTTKKGEIYELKAELNAEKKGTRKEAVKKVIASMTVGKDVSSLFPDVVNCMQTDNLELKKLVYLYLMNYAKSQPDMAIMAVNTFVRDCSDPNPLIRALAIRTMGCIRVDKITEYVCEPLRKCLRDDDPYVRKTAAVCVAKLYDINPHLVEEEGFLDMLRDLLSDPNPMVVANAVASLSELNDVNGNNQIFEITTSTLNKLLAALNECTEWGQIFILDSLAQYTPEDSQRAISICERVTPRLQHANSAVVLSAVKVIMKYMEIISDVEFVHIMSRKLAPPLVTLLSSEPEVQYVALRNINLIVQKRPNVLKQEMKVFFVKYNDPIYVKLEKLDIMIRLTTEQNITQVLAELKEYATEVDVDFVRKAVRAIGRCAIKIEQASERCIDTLLALITTKVNYVVQEAIVVIKDIFRKYPNRYESIIAKLCESLDTLDEPEAKGSMIWIIGEYAERIDNADELLETFLEVFSDETIQVQLQLLTAIVKLFLKRPAGTQELVQKVLSLATQDSDNPDLRDRGFIYWRLLSTDPAAAKAVILSEKPLIADETDVLDTPLLDELIQHISTLAAVYHKPPSAFVLGKTPGKREYPLSGASQISLSEEGAEDNRTDGKQLKPAEMDGNDLLGDLLDLDIGENPHHSVSTSATSFNYLSDLGFSSPSASSSSSAPKTMSATSMNAPFPNSDPLHFLNSPSSNLPPSQHPQTTQQPHHQPPKIQTGIEDIFGSSFSSTSSYPASDPLSDIFAAATTTASPAPYTAPLESWLPAQKGKGCEVSGTFSRLQGQISIQFTILNKGMQPLSGFAMQFNKNSFGLGLAAPLNVSTPVLPNSLIQLSCPLTTLGGVQKMTPINTLQIALKNNVDIFYFSVLVPAHVLFVEDGDIGKDQYLQTWRDIPDQQESQAEFKKNPSLSVEMMERKLKVNNIFVVAKRHVDSKDLLYMSLRFTNGLWVLLELTATFDSILLALKSRAVDVYPCVSDIVRDVLLSH